MIGVIKFLAIIAIVGVISPTSAKNTDCVLIMRCGKNIYRLEKDACGTAPVENLWNVKSYYDDYVCKVILVCGSKKIQTYHPICRREEIPETTKQWITTPHYTTPRTMDNHTTPHHTTNTGLPYHTSPNHTRPGYTTQTNTQSTNPASTTKPTTTGSVLSKKHL